MRRVNKQKLTGSLLRELFSKSVGLADGCCPKLNKRFAVLLVIFFFLSLNSNAQPVNENEAVRVDSGLVDLNVSVFSKNSKLQISSLQKNDFIIFENGNAEVITFFAEAETPFDLILLLDLSGSTQEKLKLIRKSSKKFIEAARPSDRIAIAAFTSVLKLITPFTDDRKLLKESIDRIEKPLGGTNFWDSLKLTLEHISDKEIKSRRRAIVVMTDGVDNALPGVRGDGSVTTFEGLLETIKRTDSIVVPVYLDTEKELLKKAPYLATPESYAIAREQLEQIAEESGSIVYKASKVEDLEGVYKQVIRDLGTVYSIGYQPTNNNRDGSWRELKVNLFNKPDLKVRTRRGYYAN